jgi:hypothetical protein
MRTEGLLQIVLGYMFHKQVCIHYLLLIFDGHKSHISVDLIDWAKEQKIILFILPAHTSHILQPLDVACFGPFQKIYNKVLCVG